MRNAIGAVEFLCLFRDHWRILSRHARAVMFVQALRQVSVSIL